MSSGCLQISFISPKDVFLPGGRGTSDYKVRLTLRSFESSGKDDVIIFLHSLSSFQNEDEQEHSRSPLLLHLLRYLISKLPSDGVRSVTFEWLNRRGLDPSFLVDYLSIIPSTETRYIATSSRHQRPHQILLPDVIQISVTQVLTVAQFEAIVPHLTNHNSRVIFNGFWDTEIEGFIPEQTALLNRMFNAALLDCATLRHTEVPEYFLCNAFHTWDETDVPFTVNPHIESVHMHTTTGNSALLFFLDGVALNPCIQQLYLSDLQPQFGSQHFKYLLKNVLQGHPSLKRVDIEVRQTWDDEEEDEDPLGEFVSDMGHTIVKTNLLFFAVVCTDDETSELLCHPVFQESWDQNVVPGLAMNWYTYEYEQKQGELTFTHQGTKRRRLAPTTSKPMLPLRILDVNQGNVYRLVTVQNSVQCDKSATNASLIFQMFLDTFKSQELEETTA
jgi:hypothetical protein